MLKIEKTETYGFEAAIRGMRNPKNSWGKSDSKWRYNDFKDEYEFSIGENDMKLMKTLSNAGNDHGKFMRMITVYLDITAPLYWWKEFDTYKVGTVADSCSTMHKIHAKEFTVDDFSHEHLGDNFDIETSGRAEKWNYSCVLEFVIMALNSARNEFIKTNDKKYWWQMIQLLPSSYNQKRTVMLNYAVLKNMYHARKNHKLDEWHVFCDWIETLPYARELIVGEE